VLYWSAGEAAHGRVWTMSDLDLDQKIKEELEGEPTLTVKELALRLGRNPSVISKHLSRLSKNGEIATFQYLDRDEIIKKGRFPVPRAHIKVESKRDLHVDIEPLQRTSFLHVLAKPDGEYKACGLSLSVLNNRGSRGVKLSWSWEKAEPVRDLHPLDTVEVRLLDTLHGTLTACSEDGRLFKFDDLLPSSYFMILLSVFDRSGREVRVPYLMISKYEEFLSYVYQILPDNGSAKTGTPSKAALREPTPLLSRVGGVHRHRSERVAEIEAGRYCAFSVHLGSLSAWDSYMDELTGKDEPEGGFFLSAMLVLKAVEGTDGQPVYKITLEVWHRKAPLKFIVLDERAVHGGWMDDYTDFSERITRLAKKHHVNLQIVDCDIHKDKLDACSQKLHEVKQTYAFHYLSSTRVTGLFVLNFLHSERIN
jgi:DNA-binding Lrp family transcriptional regulator